MVTDALPPGFSTQNSVAFAKIIISTRGRYEATYNNRAHNAAADACGKPKDHTEPEDDVEKLILAAAVGMG